MRIRYEEKNLGPKKLAVIDQVNAIVAEYQAQGLTLTLRQCYYQLVARAIIPNTERSYKNLGTAITDGRMCGLISWDAIEDRTRFLRANSHWDHPADIIDSAAASFRHDLWEDQPERVEVWIEKDALVGVIEQICRQLDVPYFSCRGYVSASEMWVAGQRIGRHLAAGQKVTILHLGDHDPSGMQMTEDIEARLHTFTQTDIIQGVFDDNPIATQEEATEILMSHWDNGLVIPTIDRIALTMAQVDEFNPPPNPAKMSDSRAPGYVAEFGRSSWELDALDPTTLRDLIQEHVEAHRDQATWDRAVARQEQARSELEDIAARARVELGGNQPDDEAHGGLTPPDFDDGYKTAADLEPGDIVDGDASYLHDDSDNDHGELTGHLIVDHVELSDEPDYISRNQVWRIYWVGGAMTAVMSEQLPIIETDDNDKGDN